MDVLLPECVIRIVADVHDVDFAKVHELKCVCESYDVR